MSKLFSLYCTGASGSLYGLIGASMGDWLQNSSIIDQKWKYCCSLVVSTAFGLALGLLPLVQGGHDIL